MYFLLVCTTHLITDSTFCTFLTIIFVCRYIRYNVEYDIIFIRIVTICVAMFNWSETVIIII